MCIFLHDLHNLSINIHIFLICQSRSNQPLPKLKHPPSKIVPKTLDKATLVTVQTAVSTIDKINKSMESGFREKI